jgi:hypothetical protein
MSGVEICHGGRFLTASATITIVSSLTLIIPVTGAYGPMGNESLEPSAIMMSIIYRLHGPFHDLAIKWGHMRT